MSGVSTALGSVLVSSGSSPLLTNLIAYWKLDETSGTRADSYGSNTLTLSGANGSGTGVISNAVHLVRAGNSYLSIAHNSDMATGDIDFSFVSWVKFDSVNTGSKRSVVAKSNATDGSYFLYASATGVMTWAVYGAAGFTSGTVLSSTFGTVTTGVWYFVACWHDSVANQIGIQINNGTADTASHSAGCYNVTSAAMYVGGDSFAGDVHDGYIDETGFWKRILTSGEKTSLYNSGAGLTYPF